MTTIKIKPMDTKEKQENQKQLLRKIGKYTTAAGAVLLTGNLANANVHLTTTTIDLIGGPGGNNHYYPIDFDGDGLGEISIGVSTSYWSAGGYGAFVWLTYGYDTGVTSYNQLENSNYWSNGDPAPLALNKVIGPTIESSSWWDDQSGDSIANSTNGSFDTSSGNFGAYPNETRYLGIRFTGDSGANWYYGWVGIQINNTPLSSSGSGTKVGEIIDYAYEKTPNRAILAGSGTAVPILPIASITGMGLVGLFGFLRNRRKKNSI